jgi:hypothetical protein
VLSGEQAEPAVVHRCADNPSDEQPKLIGLHFGLSPGIPPFGSIDIGRLVLLHPGVSQIPPVRAYIPCLFRVGKRDSHRRGYLAVGHPV